MAFTPMGNFSFSHILQPDTPTDTPDTLKANWDSRANELKTILNTLIAVLEATTDNSSGADNLGATAISGLSGATVQSLLEALKTYIDEVSTTQTEALTAHKTSADHDGRYFTETELGSTTDGASGADKTGATAISGWSGATVQSLLEAFGAKLNGIETGATADQTASEILTLLKTVDGAGSGLDADKLGGKGLADIASWRVASSTLITSKTGIVCTRTDFYTVSATFQTIYPGNYRITGAFTNESASYDRDCSLYVQLNNASEDGDNIIASVNAGTVAMGSSSTFTVDLPVVPAGSRLLFCGSGSNVTLDLYIRGSLTTTNPVLEGIS